MGRAVKDKQTIFYFQPCIHFNNMEATIKNHIRFLSRYEEEYTFERMMLLLLNCILQIGITCPYVGQWGIQKIAKKNENCTFGL